MGYMLFGRSNKRSISCMFTILACSIYESVIKKLSKIKILPNTTLFYADLYGKNRFYF